MIYFTAPASTQVTQMMSNVITPRIKCWLWLFIQLSSPDDISKIGQNKTKRKYIYGSRDVPYRTMMAFDMTWTVG